MVGGSNSPPSLLAMVFGSFVEVGDVSFCVFGC